MKATRFFALALVLTLLVTLGGAAGAQEPLQTGNGGCLAGAGYDPACDVNRDNRTDIQDLQLVAANWGQKGEWTSDVWLTTGNPNTDPNTHFLGTTDGQDLVINPNGGDVGIGTTSPSARLHIVAGSTQSVIYLSGGQTISRTKLGSSWNLEPTGTGDANLRVITSNPGAMGGFGIIEGDNVVAPVAWMYEYAGRNAFTVASKKYRAGTDISHIEEDLGPLFQVRENGKVGIGTTEPGQKLDVNGNAVVRQLLLVGQTSTVGYQGVTADSNDLIVKGQLAVGGRGGRRCTSWVLDMRRPVVGKAHSTWPARSASGRQIQGTTV
jgi:hypothetical protein